MRCRLFAALAALSLGILAGCGGSKTNAPEASGAVPTDPIARVAYDFFDAVRQGQTAKATKNLTPLAIQRITAGGDMIAPPGSPNASFKIAGVTQREEDHALVALTWSDLDVDGKPYHESLLCELRLVDNQWRICGMLQDLGPNQPPMMMDFEADPGVAASTPATAGAKAAPETSAASAVASPGATPAASKQMAQDPFQQPVQR